MVDETDDDPWDAVAQAMKHDPDAEEDPPPFSLLMAELAGFEGGKVPLEQSANLVLAREAARQIRLEEISVEEFLEKVQQLADVADNGIKLFSADVVKQEREKASPLLQEYATIFERQVYVLKEGTDLMARYAESGQVDDLDRGLELVEESMRAADELQDRVLAQKAEEDAAAALEGGESPAGPTA